MFFKIISGIILVLIITTNSVVSKSEGVDYTYYAKIDLGENINISDFVENISKINLSYPELIYAFIKSELSEGVLPTLIKVDKNQSLEKINREIVDIAKKEKENKKIFSDDKVVQILNFKPFDSYGFNGEVKKSKLEKTISTINELNFSEFYKNLDINELQISTKYINSFIYSTKNKDELSLIANRFNIDDLIEIPTTVELSEKLNFKANKWFLQKNNVAKDDSYNKVIGLEDRKLDELQNDNTFEYRNINTKNKTIQYQKFINDPIQNSLDTEIKKTISNINIFGSIDTQARNLNNSKDLLYLYNFNNPNLTLDLPNGNLVDGQQLQTWSRNSTINQFFSFNNDTNEIRIRGKCLDLAGASQNYGTKIQVWTCNGSNAQKFFFDGIYLRSILNNNLCIDAAGGINQGVPIQIWGCNGSSAQRWIAGQDNFNSTFAVEIKPSSYISIYNGLGTGHALVDFKSSGATIVNTMSSWPGYDTDGSNVGTYNKINNIKDNDAIYIDRDEDRDYVHNANPAFKTRTAIIGKALSDIYRYNSGYRWGANNFGLDDINYSYNLASMNRNNLNCPYFSSQLWNDIMIDANLASAKVPLTSIPVIIYNAI